VSEQDIITMISRNPHDLLDLDSVDTPPRPVDLAWAARLNADPCMDPAANPPPVRNN
jgi:hypothetical protein